jgi:hypothetical protein
LEAADGTLSDGSRLHEYAVVERFRGGRKPQVEYVESCA